jgi:hypothetical protein
VCGDLDDWTRRGIDPLAAVKTLGPRLFTIRLPAGGLQDPRWVREMARLQLRPAMFASRWTGTEPVRVFPEGSSIGQFRQLAIELTKTAPAGAAAITVRP